ncbi:hypothetical protein [Salinicoccus albus]|uniref:hypothetical protein n=1 Tax=Salinicoccus albus TaxID=418756 RepID=UPI00035D1F0E|nr:hypothetical protein [Salinicoccus albus]
MKINEFTMQMFNDHKTFINILIVEPHNQNIYADKEKNLISARSSDYNFKIVIAREIIEIDDELFFKIEFEGRDIGLFKPQKSILLIPKTNRQIKLNEHATFDNELNQYLELNVENYKEKNKNIMFSRYYAVYDSNIYECLTLVDEIICFMKPAEISELYRVTTEFTINKDTITYYDSRLHRKGKKVKASNKVYTTKHILPDENKVKFRYKGKDVWIKQEFLNINYNINRYRPDEINEVILSSIINQSEEKLENYHLYYDRILKKELNKQVNFDGTR